jgi:crossover junction endodeoxyribonuclease RusA
MTGYTLTVPGPAQPQGSTRAFVVTPKGGGKPRAVVTSDNPRMRPWRAEVRDAALQQWGERVLWPTGAVEVSAEFVLPIPRSKQTKRKAWPVFPEVKPDLDKLGRALLDALTGCAFKDDAQVGRLVLMKRYELCAEESAHTTVFVRRMECAEEVGRGHDD